MCRDTSAQAPKLPFDDVVLGPLLGQGSYGKVYRGVWNGADVACKVGHLCSRNLFLSLQVTCTLFISAHIPAVTTPFPLATVHSH